MEERRNCRIVCADTPKVIANLPFEVPNTLKILTHTGDWRPWHADAELMTMREARKEAGLIGAGKPLNRNLHAFDVEEVVGI